MAGAPGSRRFRPASRQAVDEPASRDSMAWTSLRKCSTCDWSEPIQGPVPPTLRSGRSATTAVRSTAASPLRAWISPAAPLQQLDFRCRWSIAWPSSSTFQRRVRDLRHRAERSSCRWSTLLAAPQIVHLQRRLDHRRVCASSSSRRSLPRVSASRTSTGLPAPAKWSPLATVRRHAAADARAAMQIEDPAGSCGSSKPTHLGCQFPHHVHQRDAIQPGGQFVEQSAASVSSSVPSSCSSRSPTAKTLLNVGSSTPGQQLVQQGRGRTRRRGPGRTTSLHASRARPIWSTMTLDHAATGGSCPRPASRRRGRHAPAANSDRAAPAKSQRGHAAHKLHQRRLARFVAPNTSVMRCESPRKCNLGPDAKSVHVQICDSHRASFIPSASFLTGHCGPAPPRSLAHAWRGLPVSIQITSSPRSSAGSQLRRLAQYPCAFGRVGRSDEPTQVGLPRQAAPHPSSRGLVVSSPNRRTARR